MERNRLSATLKIRGGVERDCYGKQAGKGALVQWEKSATLGVSQDQTLVVWKGDISSMLVETETGGVSPTITGDHQNRITDYTAIVLEVYENIGDTRSRRTGCVQRYVRNGEKT